MDEQIERFVERALEARSNGEPIDLQQICAESPDLIPAVERLLRLDDALDFMAVPDSLLDTVLDERYRLKECIGVGAMGAVYRATDLSLGREVAVKLLQNALFASAEKHERFVREARVLASLEHDHIVDVYDHGRSAQGMHYIVMQHLHGAPMSAVVDQAIDSSTGYSVAWLQAEFGITVGACRSDHQAIRWCAQIAAALEVTHSMGVTHRDVKPSNIFIEESGRAVLLDFGIAAKTDDGSLTAQGSTLGSPWYMAPEQVGSSADATELVDVYGLCATLYHLIALQPPYEGNYGEVVAQLLKHEPPRIQKLEPSAPRDLCAVIERGMERDPQRRYGSMAELRLDLEALTSGRPVVARPISMVARCARSVRRRPAPFAALAVLILSLAVTVPLVAWKRDVTHAEEAERKRQLYVARASLVPSMGLEGLLETRPKLDAEEREGYLQDLARVIELGEDQLFAKLLRTGLLLDAGRHAESLAELREIVDARPSKFGTALLERYRVMNTELPSVAGLDLLGLPAPSSELDHLLLGFQMYRRRDFVESDPHLAKVHHPAGLQLRLGSLLQIGMARWSENPERAVFDELFAVADQLDDAVGGPTARSLYYRGAAYHHMGDWPLADDLFRKSLALAPQAYGTNYNYGMSLINQGQEDRALEPMLRARALRPHNRMAGHQAARILAGRGEFDAALEELAPPMVPGPLAKAWHPDFFRGFVEGARAAALFGAGEDAAAREAEKRATQFYRAAQEIVGEGSSDHALIADNIILLQLLDVDPELRCLKLYRILQENPNSYTHLAALTKALDQVTELAEASYRSTLQTGFSSEAEREAALRDLGMKRSQASLIRRRAEAVRRTRNIRAPR